MDNVQLVEKYPWMKIVDPDDCVYTWAELMPQGWYKAFGELFFEDLDKALKESYPEGIPEDFQLLDLKEKWGSLRVYLSSEPRLVSDVLYKYEYISSFICIECGIPYPFAHMTYDGWVMPLCEKCYISDRTEIEQCHKNYLQTVLKDSISVCKGPEDYITIDCYDGKEHTERKIDIKTTWDKIFEGYVQRTLV